MTAKSAPGGRILFADNLRGVAALSVVCFHFLGEFWAHPGVIAQLTGLPPLPAGIHPFAPAAPSAFFRLGGFGVALFFLISGFVIPLSLASRPVAGFLAGRALRIWPTYIAGSAVTLAALAWAGGMWPVSGRALAAHLFFVRDIFGIPSFDGIVWTLEIEVKFYLLCALLSPWIRRGRTAPLLACAAGLALADIGFRFLDGHGFWAGRLAYAAALMDLDTRNLCFMFIGTVLSFSYRGQIGRMFSVRAILLLWSLYAILTLTGRSGAQAEIISYFAAASLFAACYAARAHIPQIGLLRGLAAISYPLYVIHGITGYVVMDMLLARGASSVAAAGAAGLTSLILAVILHYLVENPTHALGRRVMRGLADRPAGRTGESLSIAPIS